MAEKPIYDAPADKFIEAVALELKKVEQFKVPEWAFFVKTSVAKSRVPSREDWWHVRAASVLYQIYRKGVVGVNRLRTKYGGKKNRGMKPKRFKKGAGKNIRVILQQAEAAGLVEKFKGKKVGRRLTIKGKQFLENIARALK